MRPLAIELFAGLHGWGAGLAAAGFRVVGFDLVDMPRLLNHPVPEHCSLVLQDVLTLHGSQFRDAHLIVASPPCQEYSYMAMPFSRGKRIAAALRGQGEFPEGYRGSRTIPELTTLFDACSASSGRRRKRRAPYIPLVVENVRGAQPWVGRAKWSYGSYYLWGDIPALMPITLCTAMKSVGPQNENGERYRQSINKMRDSQKVPGQDWNRYKQAGEVNPHWRMESLKVPGMNFYDYEKTGKPGRSFQSAAVAEHIKVSGDWFGSYAEMKAAGKISPGRLHGKGSPARRAASAHSSPRSPSPWPSTSGGCTTRTERSVLHE